MNATHVSLPRTSAQRRRKPARPVQSVLLDLAYLLHANRVVRRDTGAHGK
ncbi:hypothetical protein [Gemmata sp.]